MLYVYGMQLYIHTVDRGFFFDINVLFTIINQKEEPERGPPSNLIYCIFGTVNRHKVHILVDVHGEVIVEVLKMIKMYLPKNLVNNAFLVESTPTYGVSSKPKLEQNISTM